MSAEPKHTSFTGILFLLSPRAVFLNPRRVTLRAFRLPLLVSRECKMSRAMMDCCGIRPAAALDENIARLGATFYPPLPPPRARIGAALRLFNAREFSCLGAVRFVMCLLSASRGSYVWKGCDNNVNFRQSRKGRRAPRGHMFSAYPTPLRCGGSRLAHLVVTCFRLTLPTLRLALFVVYRTGCLPLGRRKLGGAGEKAYG